MVKDRGLGLAILTQTEAQRRRLQRLEPALLALPGDLVTRFVGPDDSCISGGRKVERIGLPVPVLIGYSSLQIIGGRLRDAIDFSDFRCCQKFIRGRIKWYGIQNGWNITLREDQDFFVRCIDSN